MISFLGQARLSSEPALLGILLIQMPPRQSNQEAQDDANPKETRIVEAVRLRRRARCRILITFIWLSWRGLEACEE